MNDNNRPGIKSGLKYLVAFLLVVAAISGSWVWYSSRHGETANSSASSAPNYYVFGKLGVKTQLPSSLKGMTTTNGTPGGQPVPGMTLVQLHLSSYTNLVNKCLGVPDGTKQVVATIAKISNTAKNVPDITQPALQTFGSFYLVNLGPSLPAVAKCKDSAVQQQFKNLTNSLQSAIQQAFSNAIQI